MNDPAAGEHRVRRDRVLVLCSWNQCRSPLAEAILRREIARHGLPVDVLSAGFREPGQPATPPTVETAAVLDLDLTPHLSRRVTRELLASADLVIGMERLHVREAVVLEPAVWRHAFTLRELVRRAEAAQPRAPGEPLGDWLGILSVGRDRSALIGASPEDDVRDPTTDRTVDHDTTAVEIDDLVRRVVSRAWPS